MILHRYQGRPAFDRASLPSARAYYQTEFAKLRNNGSDRALTICPFHDDNDPSFSVNFKSGAFRCFGCGVTGGGVLDYHMLRYKLDFKEAVADLSNFVPDIKPVVPSLPAVSPEERLKKLRRVWNEAKALEEGDTVTLYLRQRGIELKQFPETLRIHPSLAYWVDGKLEGKFPAMLALVQGPDGKAISVHRTYLSNEGFKAAVPKPKKLMPPVRENGTVGSAVCLYKAGKVLGVAEGIETALACHKQTGIPTWAALSAYGLANVQIPDCVEELIIFADNDFSGTGERRAKELASRHLASKRVKIVMPDKPGTDWADYCEVDSK